jgi:tetratricopeptide (TPR) repeat protein
MPDLEPDLKRQATATIRGFAYQCYQTIRAWLQCGPDEELRCEFAEDLDLVRRDLEGQVTEAELNQVKHERKNVTLNSSAAIQLINNFFRHKSRNPGLKLKIRLCTIADRGRESEINWQYAQCGMDLWDRLRARELNGGDQATAIASLRSHLQANKHLSAEAQTFLATSNDFVFLSEIVDPVFWDTGQLPFSEIEKEIHRILSKRERPIFDPLEVEQIINRLWRNVMDLLASDSDRTLTHADLESILSEETTARVDRAMIKEMASGVVDIGQKLTDVLTALTSRQINISDAIQIHYEGFSLSNQLPPLPAICSRRTEILKDIRTKCKGRFLLWIYGSTGYGKTTITNLLSRDLNTKFLWFRLRGLVDFQLVSSLTFILKSLSEVSDCAHIIVVFDDLCLGDTNTTTVELLGKILETAKDKATEPLIIVSSQGFAPSRLSDLLGDQLITFDMPAMSGDEIGELVTNAGLVDQELFGFWTTFIEARTKGHPQLVGAYIAYAKEIGWKVSAKDFITTPPTAESVKRESRRLLAETIFSPEARELAKRLSVVHISFRRDFALAVARMNPSLKEPGHAFDSLLGPWIEVIDSNHYSLSPLLDEYAAAEVGQAGLTPYYRMTAYAWFLQKKFNQVEFLQFVTAALLAKEDLLVGHIGYVLLSMEEQKFQLMAKEISLICLFGVNGDVFLQDLQPLPRFLFRKGQLRIAAQTGQTTTYAKLDAAVLTELESKQDDQLFRSLLFTHYIQSSIARGSSVPLKERIRRAIKAIEFFQKGLIDAEYIDSFEAQVAIGQVVMLSTSTLDSREDLEYFVDEVGRQSAEVRGSIFSGFDEFSDLETLLVDRVWLSESKKDAPQWEACQTLFSKIIDFASQHSRSWLLEGAARAKMVIFDEYLEDPQSALQIAHEARRLLGATHPLIDLAESTVHFRRERYSTSLDLFDKVDQSVLPEQLTLERVFALRRAILSSAEKQSWDKVKSYAERGVELVKLLPDKTFACIAEIGFRLEMGWADHEAGDKISAANHFETGLKLLERFSDQQQRLFHNLRLRSGQMLGWLTYSSAQGTTAAMQQSKASAGPFCGMFADFEEPAVDLSDRPGAPYEGCWAMLAKYVAWDVPRERVTSLVERALMPTSKGQWYLAVWTAHGALFANDLAREDFDAALNSGLDYTRTQLLASNLREQSGDPLTTIEYGNFDFEKLGIELRDKWVESIPWVFEPILMTLCSTDSLPQIDFNAWRDVLVRNLGTHEIILNSLDWMETGLRATRGDADATANAKKMASTAGATPPAIQRLAHIICCASKGLSINECISAQASFLLKIPTILANTVFAQAFTRLAARRWIYLATEQKFWLGSPAFYAPRILDAVSQTVPTISECASLLLVVGQAARLTWPQNMLDSLSELIHAGKKVKPNMSRRD